MVDILTVNFQSLSFVFFIHALCAHAQGSVDLHVESYGVADPLVDTLYTRSLHSTNLLHGDSLMVSRLVVVIHVRACMPTYMLRVCATMTLTSTVRI